MVLVAKTFEEVIVIMVGVGVGAAVLGFGCRVLDPLNPQNRLAGRGRI